MARSVFLLLVLLNLIALAWIFLNGDERIDAGREPQRIKTALAADKIRILMPADDVPALPASVAISATPVDERCSAYSGVTLAEAQNIATAWSAKLPAAHIAVTPVMPKPVFDLVVAGLSSRSVAESKLAELKKIGIGGNSQIKAEDDTHFSVLLASFGDRNAADDALKRAIQKGAHSVAVTQRQPAAEQATIEIRGNETAVKQLPALAAPYKSLVLQACDSAKATP